MKYLIVLLIAFGLCSAQVFYRVKDHQGITIVETTDTTLLKRLQNVVIDTIQDSTCLIKLSTSLVDDTRDTLLSHLGDPIKMEYSYYYKWACDSGGIIILNRTIKPPSVLMCNRKGLDVLKKTIIDIIPDPVIVKKDTTLLSEKSLERKERSSRLNPKKYNKKE